MKRIGLIIALTFAAGGSPATTGPRPSVYPEYALQNCIEGWVDVELTVGPDGTIETVSVVKSDPPGVFDAAALEAASGWRFEPSHGNRSHKTVRRFEFRLDEAAREACADGE